MIGKKAHHIRNNDLLVIIMNMLEQIVVPSSSK